MDYNLFFFAPRLRRLFRDYDGDEAIDLTDFSLFSQHYQHSASGAPLLSPAQSTQAPLIHASLEFTEETVSRDERTLIVGVFLEDFVAFDFSCIAFDNRNKSLRFREWQPSRSYPEQTIVAPVVRNGVQELFFAIRGTKTAQSYKTKLGDVIYDVVTQDPLEISEENFAIRVADVLATNGTRPISSAVSVIKGENLRKVFHNSLGQNFPNPFNPVTTIEYSLRSSQVVRLAIYNVEGKLVKTLVDENQGANTYTVRWDGRNNRGNSVASGAYFYRLVAGDFKATKKMVLLR